MDLIVSFGGYTFANQVSYEDNFATSNPSILSVPGLDGGFSNYGQARAPSTTGRVSASFWLRATPATMVAAMDAVRRLAGIGWNQLVVAPSGRPERRLCDAIVSSVSFDNAIANRPQYLQLCSIVFMVARPVWQSVTSYTQTASGNFTQTVLGNIETYPHLEVVASGATVSISRGTDSLTVTGLSNTDRLTIDTESYSVFRNGVDWYSQLTTTQPRWFRLLPGDNTIAFSGGALTMRWRARWR